MKKSDILNKKMPAPTDKFMYVFWQQYQNLQKLVMDQWKEELAQQLVQFRGYQDFNTSRLDIHRRKSDKELVVHMTFKPVIPQEYVQTLDWFEKFFTLYVRHRKEVLKKIFEIQSGLGYIHQYKEESPETFNPKIHRIDRHERVSVHRHIQLLRSLIILGRQDKLTHDHLDLLLGCPKDDDIDLLIKESDIDVRLVSDALEKEGGHYYELPEPDMVTAFYKYARELDREQRYSVSKA